MLKKYAIMFLLCLVLLFGIRADAYGFGLINHPNERPDAGKYGTIIEQNGGVYIGPDQKELYLTFDCGYENGYTRQILEALRKTNTKAIFFITGHYLESAADIVKEMVADGHIIGNHTYAHKDFTKSSNEAILSDIRKLETSYEQIMGQPLSHYVRPPRGEFDERSMKLLKENGYVGVFWSLAYVDWHKDVFHGNRYSYQAVMKRIHPGAILLMHTVSKDNAVDLEQIILDLKKDGYVFKSLENMI